MNETDLRRVARANGLARVGIGVALLAVPGLAGRVWIGGRARTRGGKVLLRAIGVRDVLLGVATVRAVDGPVDDLRLLVRAGVVADGVDAVGTLLAARHLSWPRVLMAAAAAGSAAATGAAVDRRLGVGLRVG